MCPQIRFGIQIRPTSKLVDKFIKTFWNHMNGSPSIVEWMQLLDSYLLSTFQRWTCVDVVTYQQVNKGISLETYQSKLEK